MQSAQATGWNATSMIPIKAGMQHGKLLAGILKSFPMSIFLIPGSNGVT